MNSIATIRLFLVCGIASAVVYIATDLAASLSYPGYSFADQAVSELFAIDTPTRQWVAAAFSLSSALLLLFAHGIWLSANHHRGMRVLALAFAASAMVGLLIWNVFPMHIRGAERTFTDTMHLVFASNPFVLATLVFASISMGRAFGYYSIGMLAVLAVTAVLAFSYAPAIDQGTATPGLGLMERLSQYSYLVWQSSMAAFLLFRSAAQNSSRRSGSSSSGLLAQGQTNDCVRRD